MGEKAMLVVADTNYLQRDELAQFLSNGAEFGVVLIPEVYREALSEARVDQAREAFSILAKFPEQVYWSKRMDVLFEQRPSSQLDIIDMPGTHGLREGLKNLPTITDAVWHEAIKYSSEQSEKLLTEFIAHSADLEVAFKSERSKWRGKDRRALNDTSLRISDQQTARIVDFAFSFASLGRKNAVKGDELSERMREFSFRLGACYAAWLIGRVAQGAVKCDAREARNDQIDNVVCAYATYFSGYLTFDFKRPIYTFQEARSIIASVEHAICRSNGFANLPAIALPGGELPRERPIVDEPSHVSWLLCFANSLRGRTAVDLHAAGERGKDAILKANKGAG